MNKKSLLVLGAALVLGGGAANAQTAVSLTSVLDTATDNGGNSVYAATYSISDDKFLGSSAGTAIRIYNGATGAYESDLSLTGIPAPSGLGFFGLTAGSDGSIFGFQNGNTTLYQWDNVSDTPTTAAETVPFTRNGHVIGTGNATVVALTGDANQGPIHLYTTTDDVAYTETDTVPAAEIGSKSSMAISSDLTQAWATGDSGNPITKAVNSGSWAAETTTWVNPTGPSGAMALVYDNTNNVLFAFDDTTIYAIHGDTGADLGTLTVTNGANATPGYAGGYVDPTPGGGTLWFASRGTTATNIALQKATYTVTDSPASSVNDWTLY